ncbi:MAG: hypothetical protein NTW06_04010, partial [Candidatus Falkowbacteria bacterium]|nr:hypothetical protein [Candidatus Falkowbacteria bacterium]
MNTLIKLNRLSAWLLLVLMMIYFITGIDMLKSLWQPDFSRYLHNIILPLPTLAIVLFHAGIGLKLFLIRKQLDDKLLNFIFIFSA